MRDEIAAPRLAKHLSVWSWQKSRNPESQAEPPRQRRVAARFSGGALSVLAAASAPDFCHQLCGRGVEQHSCCSMVYTSWGDAPDATSSSCGIVAVSSVKLRPPVGARPPNIVFILVDGLRWDEFAAPDILSRKRRNAALAEGVAAKCIATTPLCTVPRKLPGTGLYRTAPGCRAIGGVVLLHVLRSVVLFRSSRCPA